MDKAPQSGSSAGQLSRVVRPRARAFVAEFQSSLASLLVLEASLCEIPKRATPTASKFQAFALLKCCPEAPCAFCCGCDGDSRPAPCLHCNRRCRAVASRPSGRDWSLLAPCLNASAEYQVHPVLLTCKKLT
eukprot:2957530-Amphidinium_carterae.1